VVAPEVVLELQSVFHIC